jgi:hypothetical protein
MSRLLVKIAYENVCHFDRRPTISGPKWRNLLWKQTSPLGPSTLLRASSCGLGRGDKRRPTIKDCDNRR